MVQLWQLTRATNESEAADARAGLRTHLRWAPIALLAVPVAIYLASYLHFWFTGHGWADFIALHRDMLAYHRNLGVVHDDSSPWWQWPLAARGVWYYVDERRREGTFVFANGNPLLYWPMVVAVAWVVIDWWGRRSTALLLLVIGFFGQWLPWAFSPRGTFIYHFMPVGAAGLHGHCGRSDRRLATGRSLSHRRDCLHRRRDRHLCLVLSALHRDPYQPRAGRSADVAGKLAVVLGSHQTRFRTRGLAISSRPTATRKSPVKRMAMTMIGGTHHHHQPLMMAAL